MPVKAYNKVLEFLIEKIKPEDNNSEFLELQKVMLRSRENFLKAVARHNEKSLTQTPEMPDEKEEGITGEFQRLPKGGTINAPDGKEVFVPEIWVRKLDIEHGDIVSAVELGVLDRSPLYEFTVVERKGLGATSSRISFIGPVLFHGGECYVYSDAEEGLISLKPREVRELGLREGDPVEVAYPAGDVAAARVAWKYTTDDPYLVKTVSGFVRKKPQSAKVLHDVGDPILAGKSVFVVGGDLYKEAFKQNFERRGARFNWESGFQGGQGKNIESKVRSADVVVLVTEMMSHRLPDVENMCQKHRKPYVYAPSKGSSGAVRACQVALLKGGR